MKKARASAAAEGSRSASDVGRSISEGIRSRIEHFRSRLLPEEAYPPYRLRGRERLLWPCLGAAAGAAAGLLFFARTAALLLGLPGAYLALRLGAGRKSLRSRREMAEGLRQYLLAVIQSLRSGYALENAMQLAERETVSICGKDSLMAAEAERFSRGIRLRIPPEKLWEDYAARCGLKTAAELARVFEAAKRQGGDYLPVLKGMADALEARALLREEIETLMTGQKAEYYAMCLIPAGILLYMRLAGDGMADPLYETAAGRIASAVIVLFYAAAVILGERILRKAYDMEE